MRTIDCDLRAIVAGTRVSIASPTLLDKPWVMENGQDQNVDHSARDTRTPSDVKSFGQDKCRSESSPDKDVASKYCAHWWAFFS